MTLPPLEATAILVMTSQSFLPVSPERSQTFRPVSSNDLLAEMGGLFDCDIYQVRKTKSPEGERHIGLYISAALFCGTSEGDGRAAEAE